MRKLAEICIARPIFATMLTAALVVAGAVGFHKLPVDRYPAVDLPQVSVRTLLPGASPEEVEATISRRMEEAVNTVDGIVELSSISASGSSVVIATFRLDRDIDSAAQDVRDRVGQVVRDLPRDALAPAVSKFNNDSGSAMSIAVSGSRPLRELTELVDKRIKPFLERASGVGEVRLDGGYQRAVSVWLDAFRLSAYGIPVTKVREALVRQNADLPGGNVTTPSTERTLRTMGRFMAPADFLDLVVETRAGVPIRIRDLGTAEDGTAEPRTITRLDGNPTVLLEVRRQSGANTVQVIEDVKAALDKLRPALPPDLTIEIVRDQSRYIHAALHEIEFHLVVGSILASLVVFWFLRSWRATFIAAIAIPASVITTFALMWALSFTLNSITMLALVLMVGVVIDDAIVVLENIHRWAHDKGVSAFEAARGATHEIGLAVLATTLSLVVIFVPVSFLSSVSGRFLFQFGITAAVAILVSMFVSFTLTPTLCARILVPARETRPAPPPRVSWSERTYAALLGFCLRHRVLTMVVSLLVVASAVPLYHGVSQDFIPTDVDEGEFEVGISGPDGASLQAMDKVMAEVEQLVLAVPGVAHVLTTVGGGFIGGVNQGQLFVRLVPYEERRFSLRKLVECTLDGRPLAAWDGLITQRDVMERVRSDLRRFPDIRCFVRNQRSLNLGGGNFDIDFAIRGPELTALEEYSRQLRARSQQLGGMPDLDHTLRLSKPELRAHIDRSRAAELGVDTQDIAMSLRLMVGGDQEVGRYRDPELDEEYDVQLRLREVDRVDPQSISQLLVSRQGGGPVRLDSVVRLEESKSASRIDRLDRQRQSSLRGSVAPGHALADCVAALRKAAGELGLPPEYTTAVSGKARELERTFWEFVAAFSLSVLFMYMILASQFESLRLPFIILLSLPLAAPFALLSLLVVGETLNLYSALGVLVLFGMVKKNSILQIDHTNQLHAKGMDPDEAVLVGSRDRLRPILMTTLAFVLGMLPLALGAGPGAEERRAISVVVIGGQMLSLFLSLLLTPVVWRMMVGRRAAAAPAVVADA